jgi:serine/threonine protein kinase
VICPNCQAEAFDIDVKCPSCGVALGATGAHRMIGQLVLGTYELVDVLGQGGMSVVFKARHKMTDQEVALKILPPELAAHSQVKSRFLDEAKALAALDHPNIVHLYNFGQENGSFVLAMQFVQGRTWERLILENKRLDWKVTCRITIDVLKALEYAHGRGVVHRDMKPSNVLVRASDGAATVMDFGIAKMTTSTRLTATGQTMGTVRYMSPEQVRGQDVDLRTDLYSLGATMYESLVGDTPFDGSTHFEIMTKHLSEAPKPPSTLGVDVPRDVEDAIMRSLAKRAQDRFETARDMRKILEGALKDGDVALVETQRLAREILGDLKVTKEDRSAQTPPGIGLAPTARAATASDLADELEPGTMSPPKLSPGRSKWPLVIVLLLVLGGGGAAAAFLLTREPEGYKSSTRVRGVKLTAGKKIGDVLVETDGTVTPDQVGAAYNDALVKLAAYDAKISAKFDVIREIAVVPGAALCEPGAYTIANEPPPSDCSAALATTTYGKGGAERLYVASDRGSVEAAMRTGVAHAVCKFQPRYLDPDSDADKAKLEQICDMTKRFLAEK